jgi:hypothetical protein
MSRKLIDNNIIWAVFMVAFFTASPAFCQYKFTAFPNYNSIPQFETNAQNSLDIDYNHTYLTLTSELNLNSNGIANDFINQFYLGYYLNTELKTQNLDRLKSQKNLIGYNWITQLQINIPSKKKGISCYAAFENHNYEEICYDKNLFQLVFFGNKDMADQHAYLDKQSFTLLKFQQIKAGIVKTWFKRSQVNVLSAGLGINNGQSTINYEIPEATFFTQSNAEYISLDMQMNMRRSDTMSSRFGAENGLGMSLDLSFYHRDANNSFGIKIDNLGFIRWNKQSQIYNKDTLIYFDGIYLDNIFNMDSTTIRLLTGDSVSDEFGYSDNTGRFTKMIPMRGSINYTRYLWNNRISLSLSLINYHFLHFNPLIRFEPTYHINIKRSLLSISPNIEYGGYGRFNYGFGLSAIICNKFFIEARTDYLNGYFDLKHSAGLGGYISIIKTL